MTLFQRCCDAVIDANPLISLPDGGVALDHVTATRAVLTCLLEHTGSPRVADEMAVMLGEQPGAPGPYVA